MRDFCHTAWTVAAEGRRPAGQAIAPQDPWAELDRSREAAGQPAPDSPRAVRVAGGAPREAENAGRPFLVEPAPAADPP